MARPIGRPLKYRHIVALLEDNEVYTPATIANLAEALGQLDPCAPLRLAKQRVRITMGRYANNHDFPKEGDDRVTIRGQAPTPGWFGWRWKALAM